MRKNNNSLLLTILGGAIFCFVFLGMAFIFTNSTKIMSGNNTPSIRNNEEEINLGDTCNNYSDWNASGGVSIVESQGSCSETPPSSGTTWCKVLRTMTTENECAAEGKPGVSTCYAVQNQVRTCNDTQLATATLTCHDRTYNGREQVIATCNGCTISSDTTQTSAGGWTIAATANNGYAWSDGTVGTKTCTATIAKASNGITNFSNATLAVGEAKTFTASATYGTVTYSIESGNDKVSLSGATVTANSVGTAVIKATVAGTSNYNSAIATVTITVTRCGAGYVEYENPNTHQMECMPNSGCSAGQWRGQNNCEACPAGFKCTGNGAKVACDDPNEYQDETGQSSCKTCGNNETSNSSNTGCVEIPSGGCTPAQYVEETSNGQGRCASCPAGSYCNGTYKVACPAGKSSPAGSTSSSSCTACMDDYISEAGGTCQRCTREHETSNATHTACVCESGYVFRNLQCVQADTSQCNISAVTKSKLTSMDTDDNDNSYYTVTVTATGTFCTGLTMTYSATNAKTPVPNTQVITSNLSTSTYTFKVYPTDMCKSSRATIELSNGKKAYSNAVTLRSDWEPIREGICEENPKYTSFQDADEHGAREYYTNLATCNGKTAYTVKWVRKGCPGSSTTSSRCYIDDDGGYQWTTNPEPSWKVVSGISKEKFCNGTETDACYADQSGAYHWGKYAKTDGYTYVSSIDSKTLCESPTGKCYKDSSDKYVFAETKPNACVQVNSCWVLESESTLEQTGDCEFTTQDACEEAKGFVEVADVNEPLECGKKSEACYVHEADGSWDWGNYGDVNGYYILQYDDGTLVPEEMCSNDVPDVPKTDMNVTQVVYICMAVLMACGVGFIYYSSVMKKNENQ